MDFLTQQFEKYKKEIEQANFDNEYSWEWKVPDGLVERWQSLSNEAKAAIYLTAKYAYDTLPYED